MTGDLQASSSSQGEVRQGLEHAATVNSWPDVDQLLVAVAEGIEKRLRWASMHWGTEDVHSDAWPHVAHAAAEAARAWHLEQVAALLDESREDVAGWMRSVRDSSAYNSGASDDDVYEAADDAIADIKQRAGMSS